MAQSLCFNIFCFLLHFVQILNASNLSNVTDNTITCTENECYIDCIKQDCNYKTITTLGTTFSMIINCSSSDFRSNNSYCLGMHVTGGAYNRYSLSILCNGWYSCNQTVIEGYMYNELNIECSGGHSCELMHILFQHTIRKHINLTFSQILIDYPVYITRSASNTADSFVGIENFNLNCSNSACNQLHIDMTNVYIGYADITCTGSYLYDEPLSWYFVVLQQININWNAYFSPLYQKAAVVFVNLLQPINPQGPITVNVNCHQCTSLHLTVSNNDVININNYNYSALISCDENGCDNAEFHFNHVKASVICNNKDACSSTVINAMSANIFDLSCYGPQACWRNTIFCPSYSKGVCQIECSDRTQSCSYMNVYVNNEYVREYLDLECPENGLNRTCDMNFNCKSMNGIEEKKRTNLTFDYGKNKYVCQDNKIDYCCPNPQTNSQQNELWFIIGIVFICLFAVMVFISVYLTWRVFRKSSVEYEKVSPEPPKKPR
eukprot:441654_1